MILKLQEGEKRNRSLSEYRLHLKPGSLLRLSREEINSKQNKERKEKGIRSEPQGQRN